MKLLSVKHLTGKMYSAEFDVGTFELEIGPTEIPGVTYVSAPSAFYQAQDYFSAAQCKKVVRDILDAVHKIN